MRERDIYPEQGPIARVEGVSTWSINHLHEGRGYLLACSKDQAHEGRVYLHACSRDQSHEGKGYLPASVPPRHWPPPPAPAAPAPPPAAETNPVRGGDIYLEQESIV